MKLYNQDQTQSFDLSIGRWLVAGVLLLVFGFGGFIAWASMAPLDSAAIAPGSLVVKDQRKTVQHRSGGVIDKILVREGQLVRKGDVLVVLSDPEASARLEQLTLQGLTLRAHLARLKTESEGVTELVWPDALTSETDPQLMMILDEQMALFHQRQLVREQELNILNQQMTQAEHQEQSYIALTRGDKAALDSLGEEISAYKQLEAKGYSSKVQILSLERQYASLKGRIQENMALAQREEERQQELASKVENFKHSYQRDIRDEQQKLKSQLREVSSALSSAKTLHDRVDIKAPIDGEVVGLKIHTEGGVAPPGEILMEVVPVGAVLVAEALINPQDIDVVVEGLNAHVRLSAFSFRKVAPVSGVVKNVSADLLEEEEAYKASIELDQEELAQYSEVNLYPGMPVEVQVVLGERTLLDYLLTPLLQALDRGLKED